MAQSGWIIFNWYPSDIKGYLSIFLQPKIANLNHHFLSLSGVKTHSPWKSKNSESNSFVGEGGVARPGCLRGRTLSLRHLGWRHFFGQPSSSTGSESNRLSQTTRNVSRARVLLSSSSVSIAALDYIHFHRWVWFVLVWFLFSMLYLPAIFASTTHFKLSSHIFTILWNLLYHTKLQQLF